MSKFIQKTLIACSILTMSAHVLAQNPSITVHKIPSRDGLTINVHLVDPIPGKNYFFSFAMYTPVGYHIRIDGGSYCQYSEDPKAKTYKEFSHKGYKSYKYGISCNPNYDNDTMNIIFTADPDVPRTIDFTSHDINAFNDYKYSGYQYGKYKNKSIPINEI